MLFLSMCVNTRCLAKNNNTYWYLGIECEHPQLKLNTSQLIITKIHLIIPVYTYNVHSNQKSEQFQSPSPPFLQMTLCDVTTANRFDIWSDWLRWVSLSPE